MTSLMKLLETSKSLSLIFDFRKKDTTNKPSILLLIIRIVLLLVLGIFVLLLHLGIYLLYLWMFFTSMPGKLVKKVRMESLGYDPDNKWLFNLSYLLLYIFVLPFELMYILVNYSIVVSSFITDCLVWILTLGKTKLTNTNLAMNEDIQLNKEIHNVDVLSIIMTVISFVAFNGFIALLAGIGDIDSVLLQWLIASVAVLGLNFLFYHFMYKMTSSSSKKAIEEKTPARTDK